MFQFSCRFAIYQLCMCSAHTDENVDTVESLLLSQEDKPQRHRTVWEILCDVGDLSIISFADYSE